MNFDAARAGTLPYASHRRQPNPQVLRWRFYLWLLAIDTACIFAGIFFSTLLYRPAAGGEHWTLIASLLVTIYMGVAFGRHTYSVRIVANPTKGALQAIRAFCLAAAMLLFVAFYLRASSSFSRVLFGLGCAATLMLLAWARLFFLRRARRIIGGNPFGVTLITEGDLPPASDETYSLVVAGADVQPDERSPAMYDRLAKSLRDADRVVVSCAPERRDVWASVLKGAKAQGEIIAPELEPYAPLGLGHWGSLPTMIVTKGPLGFVDAASKRAFDLIAAGLGLILLSPILIVVAIAVKLDSPGPVFFVQSRIGYGNEQFRMLKFRSMRVDQADAGGGRSATRDDDRVTRVGRFIRSSSLDELPQLLNVLMGDMSIVGPRPHPIGSRAEDKLFWEIDERYWHRHVAKPGLTGLAQVRGYRGATHVERDLTDRLQADLEYLNDWSIWKDVLIVAMTFRVLVHRNAF